MAKIETAGDTFFDNPSNSYINGSGAGALYHGLFGDSITAAQAADPTATAGTNGLIGGVRNTFPRVIGCNIVIQKGCSS